MRSPSRSLEPFGSKHLEDYYRGLGATFLRQTGSHRFWRLPGGERVGTLAAEAMVPCSLMRANATAQGLSYPELRARVGYPIAKTGRARGVVAVETPKASKKEVVAVAREVADLAAVCLEHHRMGTRDSSYYATVLDSLRAARAALSEIEVPTNGGPDNTCYL